MKIRFARNGDLDALRRLESQGDVRWGQDGYRAVLKRPYITLVAEIKGEIVGFIITIVVSDEIQVANVVVNVAHRRRGIGNLLLREAVSRGCKKGATSVFLEVADDNIRALSLYRKLGFDIIGKRPRFYARGADALAMRAPCHMLIND